MRLQNSLSSSGEGANIGERRRGPLMVYKEDGVGAKR